MPVLMMMRVTGDPKEFERYAAEHPDELTEIVERAKSHGVIAHRFYGSAQGEIMVVDEWPDAQSFQTFFEEMRTKIGPMMEAAGVQMDEPPTPEFWQVIDTNDKVGWGA